jgi:hypothetical protein
MFVGERLSLNNLTVTGQTLFLSQSERPVSVRCKASDRIPNQM